MEGLRIEACGRLVQDEERRVADERAGDGDSLALAARQVRRAFAQLRIVPGRHLLDELVRIGPYGGRDDLVARRAGPPVADVVRDGPAEKDRVLQHQANLTAERIQGQATDVGAVDAHLAGIGIVETGNQLGDRALAGAARADQRDHLAGTHVEAHVVQDEAVR